MKMVTIKTPKITIGEVTKKHLRIVGWLVGSWGIALLLAEITKDTRLVGLAPVLNYLGYTIQNELKKEGYLEAIRSNNN